MHTVEVEMSPHDVPSIDTCRKALRDRRAFIEMDVALIEMKGGDVINFLHRISTNDFSHFEEGEIRPTLFLTEKGKVIDLVYAVRQGDTVLLVISSGAEQRILDWLERFIIMDDVAVRRIEARPKVFLVLADNFTINNITHFTLRIFGLLFSICFVYTDADAFISTLIIHGLTPIQADAWEEFIILHGIPRYGKELQERFNPLELNLRELINFSKGCYIGQEVIARLDTYDKVQQKLCLLSITGSPRANCQPIFHSTSNKEIGVLTSWCRNFDNAALYFGLGVIKKRFASTGEEVILHNQESLATILKVFEKN